MKIYMIRHIATGNLVRLTVSSSVESEWGWGYDGHDERQMESHYSEIEYILSHSPSGDEKIFVTDDKEIIDGILSGVSKTYNFNSWEPLIDNGIPVYEMVTVEI